MKSSFQQIQIVKKDRYKTTFTVPFGHHEWNVKPFKLQNSLFHFQYILNDYSEFSVVHVLSYSKYWDQHLKTFFNVIKRNGLVVSAMKQKFDS